MKMQSSIEKNESEHVSIPSSSIQLNSRAFADSSIPVQAKLTIGQPNDKYEQEADRVAAEVVQKLHAPQTNDSQVQAQATGKKKEIQRRPSLQRKAQAPTGEANAGLESSIKQARGGGQPLDETLQTKMGAAMGADFSGVRIHTDSRSDMLNQSIQAKAFTTGQDVFFKQGEYNPGSKSGQELIAHELTHVVQQGSSPTSIQRATATAVITPQEQNAITLMKAFKGKTNAGMFASRGENLEVIDRWIATYLKSNNPDHRKEVQGACKTWLTVHGETDNPKDASSVKKRRPGILELHNVLKALDPPQQSSQPQGGPQEEEEGESSTAEMVGTTAGTAANFSGSAGDFDDANGTKVGDEIGADFVDGANAFVGVSSMIGGYQKFDKRKGLSQDNVEGATQIVEGGGKTAQGVMAVTKGIGGDKLASVGELGGAIGDGTEAVGGFVKIGIAANNLRKDWKESSRGEKFEQSLDLAESVAATAQGGIKTGLGVVKTVGAFSGQEAAAQTLTGLGSAAAIAGVVTGAIQIIQGGFQIYQGLAAKGDIKAAEQKQQELVQTIAQQQKDIDLKLQDSGQRISDIDARTTYLNQRILYLEQRFTELDNTIQLRKQDTPRPHLARRHAAELSDLRQQRENRYQEKQQRNLEKQRLKTEKQELQALPALKQQLNATETQLKALVEKYEPAMKGMKQVANHRMANGAMKAAGGGLAVVSSALVLSGVGAPIAIAIGVLSGILALSFAGLNLARSSKANDLMNTAKRLDDNGKPKGNADLEPPSYREMEKRIYKCYYNHMPDVLNDTSPPGLKTKTIGDNVFTQIKHFAWEDKKSRVDESQKLDLDDPQKSKTLNEDILKNKWIRVKVGNKVTKHEKPSGFNRFNYTISASAHSSKQAVQASKEDVADALLGMGFQSFVNGSFIDSDIKAIGGSTKDEVEKHTLKSLFSAASITGARWEKWLQECNATTPRPTPEGLQKLMKKKIVDHIK
jgi:Domain of unknown function (DUF4157)